MAQSNVTVTPDGPTPPTNMLSYGKRPPTTDGWTPQAAGTAGSATLFAAVVATSGSIDAEGKGSEALSTQPPPLQAVSTGPAWTPTPNGSHASTLSPLTNPTLASLGTPSSVSGATGTYSQTVTGANFTRQSQIYVNGVAQTTTFTSATSLTAAAVTKKTSPGTWPVTVVTGGVTTAPQTWTFT